LWAAFVALRIAGRDRRDRKQEREEEDKTHARLISLNVETLSGRPVLLVKVRNFGPLPVLDITATEATWSEHPTARCPINRQGRGRVDREQSILRPWQNDQTYEEMIQFEIEFPHPTEDKTLVATVENGFRVAA
jgi:hypothetical protein